MMITVEQHLDGIDKLTDQAAKKRVTSKVTQRFKGVMERHVPMRKGTLRRSADLNSRFDAGDIVYSTPYAQMQYRLHTANRTTPGTDGEWDKAAIRSDGNALTQDAEAVLAEELS